MSIDTQSNPVYFSAASIPSSDEPRTVVLHKKNYSESFGVYIGEDVPYGLYVVTVDPESPAAKASIQPGDRVLSINGELVANIQGNAKRALVNAASQAQSISLSIQRTDIFEKLDIPIKNSSIQSSAPLITTSSEPLTSQPPLQPNLSKHILGPVKTEHYINTDLEKYIKSLFIGEDIEILPSNQSTGNQHEFILAKKGEAPSEPIYEKIAGSSVHSKTDQRRRRPSKKRRMKNNQTQTSFTNLSEISKKDSELSSPPSQGKPPVPPKISKTPSLTQSELSSIPSLNKFAPNNSDSKPTAPSKRSETVSSGWSDDEGKATIISKPEQSQPSGIPQVIITEASPPTVHSRSGTKGDSSPPPPSQKFDKNDEKNVNTSETNLNQQNKARQNMADIVSTVLVAKSEEPELVSSQPISAVPFENHEEDRSFELLGKVKGDNVRHVFIQRRNGFLGYGFSVQYNKLYFLIKNVEPDSPSSQGDLWVNDVIHFINNQATENMPHSTFVKIVNDSAYLNLIVQNYDAYRRAKPYGSTNPNANNMTSSSMMKAPQKNSQKNVFRRVYSKFTGE